MKIKETNVKTIMFDTEEVRVAVLEYARKKNSAIKDQLKLVKCTVELEVGYKTEDPDSVYVSGATIEIRKDLIN